MKPQREGGGEWEGYAQEKFYAKKWEKYNMIL